VYFFHGSLVVILKYTHPSSALTLTHCFPIPRDDGIPIILMATLYTPIHLPTSSPSYCIRYADGRQKQSTPDGTSLEKLLDGTKVQTMPVSVWLCLSVFYVYMFPPVNPPTHPSNLLHALLASLASLSLTLLIRSSHHDRSPPRLTLHSLHAFVGPRPPFSLHM
jgi:hypothetical protein